MSAANTDKFIKGAKNWVGAIGAGGVSDAVVTTVPLVSSTNLPTDTAVEITIDRVDANGTETPSKMEVVRGVVSSTNIIDCIRGVEGTAQAHSAGAIVEVMLTASQWNSMIDAILAEHGQDGMHKNIASAAEVNTGTDDAKFMTAKSLKDSILLNLAEGQMINGRILPSAASNNLTVALKTLAGTDPSVSDPVYVMIGGVLRTITAALSVPAAAATSWLNLGSAELATKEADLFQYLCYNSNTSSVITITSRYPAANLISDFTDSTTAEKGYIYTGTKPASTDVVVNIGRFAATLSAGAGYTWSVPTFTAINLIQRPIFETRWLTWIPVLSAEGSTVPTYTLEFINIYKIIGDRIEYSCNWGNSSGGTAGSGVGDLFVSTPISISTLQINQTNRGTVGSGMLLESAGSVGFINIYSRTTALFALGDSVGNNFTANDQSSTVRYISFAGKYRI